MSQHLSDAQLDALVQDTLDLPERTNAELHLDDCVECLNRLVAIGDRLASEIGIDQLSQHAAQPVDVSSCFTIVDGDATTTVSKRASVTTDLNFVRPIKRGGLGQVVEYTDTAFSRPVAIKMLQDRWARNPSCIERFRREMSITANIDHPGCPAVYGSGATPDGREYFWMQKVTGPTLDEVLSKYHGSPDKRLLRLDPEFRRLLEIFRHVCQTIAAAHKRRIVHRDLKPANIRIHHDGHPIVLDWGLAKRLDDDNKDVTEPAASEKVSRLTQHGVAFGTPDYMPPEQARGEGDSFGFATDIYGLGAILHELLTGKPPHADLVSSCPDRMTLMKAIGQASAPVLAGTPSELASICRKALALQPNMRYDNAADVAADIERWLATDVVSAHRYGTTGRAALAIRRRPITTLVGMFVVAVMVAAGFFIHHLATMSTVQREIAEERFKLAMDAHVGLVTDVQEELGKEGRTILVRERLLERAVQGIEQLVERAKGQPGAELVAIQGRLELAHLVYRERGEVAEARRLYEAIYNDLLAMTSQNESDLQFHKLCGDALKGLASCTLDEQGVTAAKPLFDQWHREANSLYSRFPKQPSVAMMLSQSHVGQGRLAERSGPSGEADAIRNYLKARDVLDTVAELTPGESRYEYERLIAITELASLYSRKEKWDEAISNQQESVDAMTRLVQREPTRKYRLGLLQDRMNLALFVKGKGDAELAIDHLSQTLQDAEVLAKDFPDDDAIRKLTWDVRDNLATAYRAAGFPERAIELLSMSAKNFMTFDPEGATVVQLSDQAIVNGALARAHENLEQFAKAAERYFEAFQFRRLILSRDPVDMENMYQLLVSIRKFSQCAGRTSASSDVCQDIAKTLMNIDVELETEKWDNKLRQELAGAYFFLGKVQLSDKSVASSTEALASLRRAKGLLMSLDYVAPGLIDTTDALIAECVSNINSAKTDAPLPQP